MLHDVLAFAFTMLVDNGRLCMWMPTANEDDTELDLPSHPGLELLSASIQDFNKCTFEHRSRLSQEYLLMAKPQGQEDY